MPGWKKNIPAISPREKRLFIEPDHPTLSITRQASLLGISRASVYYVPRPNLEDIRMTHAIDAIYTAHPFYGSRRIALALHDEYDILANRKKVQRLMRRMGIAAIMPRTCTSAPGPEHRIYPYLLRNLAIRRPNHVWGTDITYIRMAQGFCYVTAILDWFSRYVVAWELSATMDVEFCLIALRSALTCAIPDIHNSDQGAQYTAEAYTDILHAHHIAISMDGKGRYLDNIFTERLWRTLKYEEVYLKEYRTLDEARDGLATYFTFYNHERRHQALGYKTPAAVYGAGV